MKIAFVEPPSPWLVRKRAQVPIGPLYLLTILKNAGHEVKLFRPDDVGELEQLKGSDVLMFSGTTLESPMVNNCAAAARIIVKPKAIWYGGPHASAMAHSVGNSSLFDSIGVGEAESYILRMADDTENGTLRRIYWPVKSTNVNTIPIPDRSIIEGSHGGDIFAFGENYDGVGHENVITARGCPYACAYCSSQTLWHNQLYLRSAENVLEEISNIVDLWGTKQIRFCDDHIAARKDRLVELCNGFKELGISWRCSVRADSLTPELCEIMADGGCKEVSVGLESGDQRVLDALDKRATLDAAWTGCAAATAAGIKVRVLLMIGTPGEYQDTPEITCEFLEMLNYHSLTLSTFIPLPGTPIWLNPEKYNCEIVTQDFRRYNRDFWVSDGHGGKEKRSYDPLIRNLQLTPEQQIDNVLRMETCVEESNKLNQG